VKIEMREDDSSSQLSLQRRDVGVVGQPVDDRGKAAIAFLRTQAEVVISLDYHVDEFQIEIDGIRCDADAIDDYFNQLHGKSIILEATTLGFAEIFLTCRALRESGFPTVSLLYVEPHQYSNPRRSQLLHRRDFELSDQVPGYKPIPGSTFMLSDRSSQRGVFLLGYEEQRLDRAFEDFQMIRSTKCSIVFGVPAFKPGWEMDAFANNIRVIRERNIRGGVHFWGAESPAATVEVLNEIHLELADNERLFLVPIGTKPMGIGAALFAAAHSNIGILYDHPRRRVGRSTATGRWHLFEVEF
jgi:hypothetical protein